jgi:hypothetical protein
MATKQTGVRKKRKSRAKGATPPNIGRPQVSDPRQTSHLMLTRAEREACDALAQKMGLGFSPWARYLLLAAVAEGAIARKLPYGMMGHMVLLMARAVMRELHRLPPTERDKAIACLVTALTNFDELEVEKLALLGASHDTPNG